MSFGKAGLQGSGVSMDSSLQELQRFWEVVAG